MARTTALVKLNAAALAAPPSPDEATLPQVRMSGVGLHMPPGLSFEEWARAGCQLSGIVDSSAWWLGDWLVFGKTHYADSYQIAIQRAGLQYQTLRNYAWVARRFEVGRRRPTLTFQHHAEVASLPVDEQERLLEQAERETWTTKQLRNAIRQARDRDSNGRALEPVNCRIDVPRNRAGIWQKAAERLGVDFDHWILTILDRAAEETLNGGYADRMTEVLAT